MDSSKDGRINNNFSLNSSEKLLFVQLICVGLSVSSYLSTLSSFYQSFLAPFGAQAFVALLCVLSLLISIPYHFRLPLPSAANVESIFGPSIRITTGAGNMTMVSFLQNEISCQCHGSSMGSGTTNLSSAVIGHRAGAGMGVPENSLAAIQKCASMGCSIVEFDVCLTKDLVPVLFHDETLSRVMGINRRISDVNWGDLRMFGISEEKPGERVPTLDEAVETCLLFGIRFIIDIKDEQDELIDAILGVFRKYGDAAYSRGAVSSFYFRVIYKIRNRDPNIVGCLAWRPAYFALPCVPSGDTNVVASSPTSLETLMSKVAVPLIYGINDFAMNYVYWWMLGLSALFVHKDSLNLEIVNKIRGRGLKVYAWTVNCPVEKQYFLKKLQIGYLTDTLLWENNASSHKL